MFSKNFILAIMHAVRMSLLSLDKVTYLMHVSLEPILPDPQLPA